MYGVVKTKRAYHIAFRPTEESGMEIYETSYPDILSAVEMGKSLKAFQHYVVRRWPNGSYDLQMGKNSTGPKDRDAIVNLMQLID